MFFLDSACVRACVIFCVCTAQLLGPDLRSRLKELWEALAYATSALEELASRQEVPEKLASAGRE